MKKQNLTRRFLPILTACLAISALSACNTLSRFSEVGGGPKLTNIENPIAKPAYRPVSLPMPAPQIAEDNPSSLWRNGARAFFKDHRAKEIGDIVTVKLDLSDSATLANSTERDRNDSEDTNVTNLLGLEGEFAQGLTAGNFTRVRHEFLITSTKPKVTAGIERSETIDLTFASRL